MSSLKFFEGAQRKPLFQVAATAPVTISLLFAEHGHLVTWPRTNQEVFDLPLTRATAMVERTEGPVLDAFGVQQLLGDMAARISLSVEHFACRGFWKRMNANQEVTGQDLYYVAMLKDQEVSDQLLEQLSQIQIPGEAYGRMNVQGGFIISEMEAFPSQGIAEQKVGYLLPVGTEPGLKVA